MRPAALLLSALLAADLARASEEPPRATLPYRLLCQMAQFDAKDMPGVTNRTQSIVVSSRNPGVKTADIVLYIDAKSGRIPLPIDADGALTLPVSQALFDENPPVVANQPKGSMHLSYRFSFQGLSPDLLQHLKEGRVRYSEVFVGEKLKESMLRGLSEAEKMGDFRKNLDSGSVSRLRAKNNPADATVTILATNGEIAVERDAAGGFTLRCDPALMAQDPWIRLSPPEGWSFQFGDAVQEKP